MRHLFRILHLILLLASGIRLLHAQSVPDTLKTVVIRDNREHGVEAGEEQISARNLQAFRFNSLDALLQAGSNVFIRQYGVSNLSTLSIRGSSAAQTSVLWNGLPINQALSGLTDFSLLPVGLFDRVRIQYSSTRDARQISGSVLLDDEAPRYEKGIRWTLGMQGESLLRGNTHLRVSSGGANCSNLFRISAGGGRNRFRFWNADKEKQDTLKGADALGYHVMNSHYRRRGRHEVSWHTWWQDTRRGIAPASFEPGSGRSEDISAWRNQLRWKWSDHAGLNLQASAGALGEKYRFRDSLIGMDQSNGSFSLPYSLEAGRKWSEHLHVEIGSNGQYSVLQGKPDSFLHRIALWTAYRGSLLKDRLQTSLLLRAEQSNLFRLPLAMQANVRWKLYHNIQLYAGYARSNRVPTLNELYYEPGGNPGLKPERSRNWEGGLLFRQVNKSWSAEADLSVFSRRVDDWIVWFGQSILTPHNILQVYSRGTEAVLHGHILLNEKSGGRASRFACAPSETRLLFNLHYAYTLSTTEGSLLTGDHSLGKQIPYVPRYQYRAEMALQPGPFELGLNLQYAGYRFVTTDESQWLPPYRLWGLQGQWNSALNHSLRLVFQARMHNLSGMNYQSMVGRYMPGRTLEIALRLEWE